MNSGHVAEFFAFGVSAWTARFRACGLRVDRVLGMPFYVGHGNRYIPLIKFGNRAGWSAGFTYVVRAE